MDAQISLVLEIFDTRISLIWKFYLKNICLFPKLKKIYENACVIGRTLNKYRYIINFYYKHLSRIIGI